MSVWPISFIPDETLKVCTTATMDKNGFYVTLPSNSSLEVYPNNKIWCYRTKLAKAIVLSEPHEVGLIEIQYPKVWHSFTAADACVDIYDSKTTITSSVALAVGVYETMDDIVKEFNFRISMLDNMEGVTMIYNVVKNIIYLTGSAQGMSLTFRGRVAAMLGFKPEQPFSIHHDKRFKTYYAPYPADIYGGCYNIFVYSDIVDYQLVGDSYVPLLRCINVSDEAQHIPTLTYDRPHYTSLSKNVIDDIEIVLKDDQNQHIPFLYGKVTVKLLQTCKTVFLETIG